MINHKQIFKTGNRASNLRPRGFERVTAYLRLPIRRYFAVSTRLVAAALALAIGTSVLSFASTEREVSPVSYPPLEQVHLSFISSPVTESLTSRIEGPVAAPPLSLELPEDVIAAEEARLAEAALLAAKGSNALSFKAPERAPVREDPASYVVSRRITGVNLTFYDCRVQGFCGAMYNGRKVYQGAAACSWNLAIGTRFLIVGDPTGRIYRCEDRGHLANTWVDIFWHDPVDGYRWQSAVGRYGTIEIVSTP